MSAKHTPGPWHYIEVPGGEYEIRVANGAWLLRLASAPDPTEEQRQEDEANVRMAAASADLLEAAQAAWNCISELPPTQARVETALLLQASIEKATGAAS